MSFWRLIHIWTVDNLVRNNFLAKKTKLSTFGVWITSLIIKRLCNLIYTDTIVFSAFSLVFFGVFLPSRQCPPPLN